MDFHDILVIILMFAVPVVSAVIDSRNKAKKKAEKAARQQTWRPETFRPFTSVDPEMPEEEDDEEDYEPEEFQEQPGTVPHGDIVEGQSSIPHAEKAPETTPVQEPEEKEKIDVEKLIIYDAILNPKFKEHDGLI